MILVKHVAGKELSAAELRQRRNAARARWAAGSALLGAGIGAEIAGDRAGMRSADQMFAEAAMRATTINTLQESAARQVDAEAARRREAIVDAIRRRLGTGIPKAERQARARDLLGNPRGLAGRPALTPIIGNVKNKRVYGYEIAQVGRQLRMEQRHLARLVAVAGDDIDRPDLRRQRERVAQLQERIAGLERMWTAAPRPTGRSATQARRGGKQVAVRATTEEKFVGGETGPQLKRRILRARADLLSTKRDKMGRPVGTQPRLLEMLDRRTGRLRAAAQQRVLDVEQASIQAAFERGDYGSRFLRARGKGALLGAGLGLTLAGIGMLAHHVAVAAIKKRSRSVAKIADSGEELLAKAASDSPEGQMGLGLAQTYRRWIDRLLGRNDEPMNLGDGIAEATAPGLVGAYAEGLTKPPIVEPSEPGFHIDVDFDVINPAQRRHMAEYALDRIVQLTDAQRQAIRDVLLNQTVLQGIGPLQIATQLQHTIGLTAYQQGVVQSFRAGLQSLDPRVLERKLRDRRYDATIKRAIDSNTPLTPEQVATMTDAYHRRMVALRARTIARTEALRATSYGGLARAQEVLDAHPELEVTKRWLATDDARTRDTHRDLNGREVDGITTNFITSHGNQIRWPCDENAVADETINCRCTLQYIFKPKRGQLRVVAA